jgi:hypothetical protein
VVCQTIHLRIFLDFGQGLRVVQSHRWPAPDRKITALAGDWGGSIPSHSLSGVVEVEVAPDIESAEQLPKQSATGAASVQVEVGIGDE